ncbi:uncharacterized protein LOC144433953 [Glandiceps talaboti]
MASSSCSKMYNKGNAMFDSSFTMDNQLSGNDSREEPLQWDETNSSVTDIRNAPLCENTSNNKPSVTLSVQTDSLNPKKLQDNFGDSVTVGLSLPYKFSIDITSAVIGSLYERKEENLARHLQESGNPVYLVFEDLTTEKSDCSSVRVTLLGCKSTYVDQVQTLINSDLCEDKVYSVYEVVEHIINVLDVAPTDSLMINTDVKYKYCSRFLKLNHVKSVCGWRYKCLTPYQACQTHFSAQDSGGSSYTNNHQTSNPTIIDDFTDMSSDYCGICYDVISGSQDATSLHNCRHWFCNSCWRMHVSARVQQGDISITCPEYKCKEMVDLVTLMSVMTVSQYYNYTRQQSESKLNSKLNYQWCPSSKCGRIVQFDQTCQSTSVSVNCDCGKLWCSECKEEAHWPATCDQATTYRDLRKNNGDDNSHTSPLISYVKVKKCPECRHPMEKNGGCPNMTCRCGIRFCWDCLTSLDSTDHGWLSCQRNRRDLETVALYGYHSVSFHMDFYQISVKYHKARSYTSLANFKRAAKKLAGKMLLQKTKVKRHKQSVPLYTRGSVSDISSDSSGYSSSDSDKHNTIDLKELQTSLSHENNDMFIDCKQFVKEISQFYAEIVYVTEHVAVLCGKCSKRKRSKVILQVLWQLEFVISMINQLIVDGEDGYKENFPDRLCSLMRCGVDAMKTLVRYVPNLQRRLAQQQH